MSALLVIRADGNPDIGSGHIVRCSAIASAARTFGCETVFVVSDKRSAQLVEARKLHAEIIDGDPMSFDERDGEKLALFAKQHDADLLLVDSYAVSPTFFSAMQGMLETTYFDDGFLFANGSLSIPKKWNVERIVNYGFGYSQNEYKRVYKAAKTELLVGPKYAPVRQSFANADYFVSANVDRVLVTSGSTNPNATLERMVCGVREALPSARIDVVVGPLASVDLSASDDHIELHKGVTDLSPLMMTADIAVSAAGSTLYELCCVGVPTVAAPIVSNQVANAFGLDKLGMGLAVSQLDWSAGDIAKAVKSLAESVEKRTMLSSQARSVVDGFGASRIASAIVGKLFVRMNSNGR